MNRRQFIGGSAASLALAALEKSGLAAAPLAAKRRVGLIGCGWYGKSDLFRLMQVADVEVVGLCDPDRNQREGAERLVRERQGGGKRIALFGDHRSMLRQQQPEIVLIGTPDHWHALQTIDALEAGAHVYVQKPISVDVMEGEAMVAAARRYGRVVQVGLQRRSTPHLVEAKRRFIDSGLIGKVHHAEMFCYYHMRNGGNPPLQAVPEFLDYEMWTGPAPLRPYDGLPHRGWWRAFMEYGNGITGDMCVHMYDAVRWMLGLGWPTRVVATGGILGNHEGKSNIADTQTAVFEHDGMSCVWQHRTWGAPADPQYPWGFKIHGEKGTLCGDTFKYDFIPAGKGERIHGDVLWEKEEYPGDLTEKDIELHAAPATRRQMRDFLTAIDTGGRPVADIHEGHISTASCILANLSMELGRPLAYDPDTRSVKNDPAATARLQRTYRSPWQHPTPDAIR